MPVTHELKHWIWLPVLSLAMWAGLFQHNLLSAPQPSVFSIVPVYSETITKDSSCGSVDEVRTLFTSEWGVPHPAGVSYSLQRDHLALVNRTGSEREPEEGATISVITPYEDWIGTARLDFAVDDSTHIAYYDGPMTGLRSGSTEQEGALQLLLLNHEQAQLAHVTVGEDGLPDNETLTVSDISYLGLKSATGMDVDSAGRRLFILDSSTLRMVGTGLEENSTPVTEIDLSSLGAADLRGLAFHPHSGHLFTISAETQILYEISESGRLVNRYDLAPLALVDPSGLAIGPSADLTDTADTMHLFLADTYWEHSEGLLGHILELALDSDCNDNGSGEPDPIQAGLSGLTSSHSASEDPAHGTSCSLLFN